LYIVDESMQLIDFSYQALIRTFMKSYVPMVTLLTLFFTLNGTAQDTFIVSGNENLGRDIEESILVNTENSKDYQTLFAGMKAADLAQILNNDGAFTVFAPSDEAFKTLFASKTSTLMNPENKEELQALFRYHVIAEKLTASKILMAMCRGEGRATFTTVQGGKITATMSGIDIILTDKLGNSAKIVTADANQCNGVIHEIDSVILPKKISLLP